jgi:hypothetical protein
MPEGSSERQQVPDAEHVDQLLTVFRHRGLADPPAALRERLAQLSANRLSPARSEGQWFAARSWRILGLATALATLAAGAVLIGFCLRRPGPRPVAERSVGAPSREAVASSAAETRIVSVPGGMRQNQNEAALQRGSGEPDRVILPLPYSTGATAAGTASAIPILVSQNELVALGFPAQPTLANRRIAAHLILGDDGLPRAISVPLTPASIGGAE